jgi:hypothetical protein
MMHQTWLWLSLRQRHLQRRDRHFGFQGAAQSPADHSARKCIQHHGQVSELRAQSDVGDVGHPQLIDPGEHYL